MEKEKECLKTEVGSIIPYLKSDRQIENELVCDGKWGEPTYEETRTGGKGTKSTQAHSHQWWKMLKALG